MPEKDGEAVCFTAGPQGAAFGAGVIHAWLASDRKPPVVVAGISTGALTAAAMQRSYRALVALPPGVAYDQREQARWTWFRKYLTAVSVDPLEFLWRAIPDPVDFFAEKPPVRDVSADQLPRDMRGYVRGNKEKTTEPYARRHYFLLTKLGIWLARLPLQVRTAARILVHYVRWKEGYALPTMQFFLFSANCAVAVASILWHVVFSPTFLWEKSFRDPASPDRFYFRPLFGWKVWCGALLLFAGLLVLSVSAVGVTAAAVFLLISRVSILLGGQPWIAVGLGLTLGAYIHSGERTRLRLRFRRLASAAAWAFGTELARSLDLSSGILHAFELKRRLFCLFGRETLRNKPGEPELLVVCAALEFEKQVWLRRHVRVIDALTAAMAVPGVFPPVSFRISKLRSHPSLMNKPEWNRPRANLIDGVAVRSNPLPALFTWCQTRWAEAVAVPHPENPGEMVDVERIADNPLDPKNADWGERRRLHVVYSVPIDEEPRPAAEQIDIVESARTAQRLAQRRDTRQEVRQTNFLSQLESYRRLATRHRKRFRLFADEIAPSQTIEFENDWEPTRTESLRVAADGCRQTLQVLYRPQIEKLQTGEEVLCSELLRIVSPARNSFCGLPEICEQCSGQLLLKPERQHDEPPPGVVQTYGSKDQSYGPNRPELFPASDFTHLRRTDAEPRLVFLGSGGVFRGAFHIGVIGAIQVARAYPDMVVGASVGALMGGALANISVSNDVRGAGVLHQLAELFLCVDGKVALTHTLKTALKHLGTSASDIRLSPAEVREMVLRGSRDDSGYAATGAPPALIDAINSLLLIPHRETADIASDFVSGNFAQATNRFLSAIRRHTLGNLRIRYAFMGTSLLEAQARQLLQRPGGGGLDTVQPYHRNVDSMRTPVSFFCTTSFLNHRISLLLGRDFLTRTDSYDFVESTLSSSAFPAVFSPRAEAQVCPGQGRTDRLFADGGMFDNLPIVPAIEVLAASQVSPARLPLAAVLGRVKSRNERPDVLLTAGLEAEPANADGPWDTFAKIHARAQSLSVKSKVESFAGVARQTQLSLDDIIANGRRLEKLPLVKQQRAAAFLDGVVATQIVNVVPTDAAHINPTFAFCRAAGLDKETVQTSIADGCYRTLLKLQQDQPKFPANRQTPVAIPVLAPGERRPADCAWFQIAGKNVACPFGEAQSSEVSHIRSVCAKDPAHRP